MDTYRWSFWEIVFSSTLFPLISRSISYIQVLFSPSWIQNGGYFSHSSNLIPLKCLRYNIVLHIKMFKKLCRIRILRVEIREINRKSPFWISKWRTTYKYIFPITYSRCILRQCLFSSKLFSLRSRTIWCIRFYVPPFCIQNGDHLFAECPI